MSQPKKKIKTCQEADCNLKGFFYRTLPSGDKVLCFPANHHGEKHLVELILPEGVLELKPLRSREVDKCSLSNKVTLKQSPPKLPKNELLRFTF